MKIKALLYCTKAKPYLKKIDNYFLDKHNDNYYWKEGQTVPCNLNGKIVAECDYEVEKIIHNVFTSQNNEDRDYYYLKSEHNLVNESCLRECEIDNYLKQNNGCAIHIKNLNIFDKPKELSDYITKQCQFAKCSTCKYGKNNIICSTIDTPITKAPQNMMYAFDNELNKYILISIQPQWMCKILNGDKTIEVRKVVLKEMI